MSLPPLLNPTCVLSAERLRRPLMGTELVAPLLYYLVRALRPRRVLEIGAGYTTVFLAQALADNVESFESELAAMVDKCGRFRPAEPPPTDEALRSWLEEAPALGAPSHYEDDYIPRLIVVDDFSNRLSAAEQLEPVLDERGLSRWVRTIRSGLADARGQFEPDDQPFDMIWVDCDQAFRAFDLYWGSLSRAGGLFAVHSLVSDPGGSDVLDYIVDSLQGTDDEAVELLNLIEPHKVAQNGLTLLRRNSGYREKAFGVDAAALLAVEAGRLLQSRRRREPA